MITTVLALLAFTAALCAGSIFVLWIGEPGPAVWVAASLGSLGLVLALASGTIGFADLGTVAGVTLLAGVLGAGWDLERRKILLALGYAGLLAGLLSRFFALTATLGSTSATLSGNLPWDLARSAGFVAFLAATGAVVLGARRPSSLPLRGLPARIYALHRALGIVSLAALGTHLAALRFDTFIGFTWSELLLVPWTGGYRPLAVTVGWAAMLFLILTAASGGLRRFLPGWRTVHALAYATFATSLLHGVLAGSDSGSPWAVTLYLVTATAVTAVVLLRLVPAWRPTRPAKRQAG